MVENKLDQNGLTLIEVIVTIAVMGIILIALFGVFTTGLTIYRDIYSYHEMQQQSQLIMDFLSDAAMHSEKIDYISDESDVREFRLRDRALRENEMHVFSLQMDPKVEGKSLRYGKKPPATIEVGNYIDKISLKPLPNGTRYEDASGIKVTLKMHKRGKSLEVFKKIYFRN